MASLWRYHSSRQQRGSCFITSPSSLITLASPQDAVTWKSDGVLPTQLFTSLVWLCFFLLQRFPQTLCLNSHYMTLFWSFLKQWPCNAVVASSQFPCVTGNCLSPVVLCSVFLHSEQFTQGNYTSNFSHVEFHFFYFSQQIRWLKSWPSSHNLACVSLRPRLSLWFPVKWPWHVVWVPHLIWTTVHLMWIRRSQMALWFSDVPLLSVLKQQEAGRAVRRWFKTSVILYEWVIFTCAHL